MRAGLAGGLSGALRCRPRSGSLKEPAAVSALGGCCCVFWLWVSFLSSGFGYFVFHTLASNCLPSVLPAHFRDDDAWWLACVRACVCVMMISRTKRWCDIRMKQGARLMNIALPGMRGVKGHAALHRYDEWGPKPTSVWMGTTCRKARFLLLSKQQL